MDYYIILDVNQLMNIVQICLTYCQSEPLVSGEKVPPMLHLAREFVNILINAFPSHKDILYLSAFIKYLNAEIGSALSLVDRCLQAEPNLISAHLLMARIAIFDKNYKMANKSLENALLLDFQVLVGFFHAIFSCLLLIVYAKQNENNHTKLKSECVCVYRYATIFHILWPKQLC